MKAYAVILIAFTAVVSVVILAGVTTLYKYIEAVYPL